MSETLISTLHSRRVINRESLIKNEAAQKELTENFIDIPEDERLSAKKDLAELQAEVTLLSAESEELQERYRAAYIEPLIEDDIEARSQAANANQEFIAAKSAMRNLEIRLRKHSANDRNAGRSKERLQEYADLEIEYAKSKVTFGVTSQISSQKRERVNTTSSALEYAEQNKDFGIID